MGPIILNIPFSQYLNTMGMTEKNITETMLEVAQKRGKYGATRDDFFKEIRGVAYNELKLKAQELEQEGYIKIDWIDSFDFVITVTPKGMELLNNT